MRRDFSDCAAEAVAFLAVGALVMPPLVALSMAEDALAFVRRLTKKEPPATGGRGGFRGKRDSR